MVKYRYLLERIKRFLTCARAEIIKAYQETLEAIRPKEAKAQESIVSLMRSVDEAEKVGARNYTPAIMEDVNEILTKAKEALERKGYRKVIELSSDGMRLARKAREEAEKRVMTGKYLYCLIPATEGRINFGNIGIENAEVYTVSFGDIAAVVTDTSVMVYEPSDDNLQRHNDVVSEVLKGHTVVPVAFGMVIKDGLRLKSVLEIAGTQITKAIDVVKGKVELGVRVIRPKGAEFDEEGFASDIKRLPEMAAASKLSRRVSNSLLLDIHYLVAKEDAERFYEEIGRLVEKYKELKINSTGPWAPYHFVKIKIGKGYKGEGT